MNIVVRQGPFAMSMYPRTRRDVPSSGGNGVSKRRDCTSSPVLLWISIPPETEPSNRMVGHVAPLSRLNSTWSVTTVEAFGQIVGSADVQRMISMPNELAQSGKAVDGSSLCPLG